MAVLLVDLMPAESADWGMKGRSWHRNGMWSNSSRTPTSELHATAAGARIGGCVTRAVVINRSFVLVHPVPSKSAMACGGGVGVLQALTRKW